MASTGCPVRPVCGLQAKPDLFAFGQYCGAPVRRDRLHDGQPPPTRRHQVIIVRNLWQEVEPAVGYSDFEEPIRYGGGDRGTTFSVANRIGDDFTDKKTRRSAREKRSPTIQAKQPANAAPPMEPYRPRSPLLRSAQVKSPSLLNALLTRRTYGDSCRLLGAPPTCATYPVSSPTNAERPPSRAWGHRSPLHPLAQLEKSVYSSQSGDQSTIQFLLSPMPGGRSLLVC